MTTKAVAPPGLDPAVARGLGLVHRLLGLEVRRMRAAGIPVGEDDYRGLYTSDEEADRLLAHAGEEEDLPGGQLVRKGIAGLLQAESGPLARVASLAELEAFDLGCMLLCLASEVDLGVERLIGYVQDDVTKRRPRVDLALRLLVPPAERYAARERFDAEAPLRRLRLLTLHDEAGQPQTPLLARYLALAPRVASFLAGGTAIDEEIGPFARVHETSGERASHLPPGVEEPLAALAALPATRLEPPVVALSGPDPAAHLEAARRLAAGSGLSLVRVALPALAAEAGFDAAVTLSTREAALRGAAVLLEGVDQLDGADGALLRTLLREERTAPLVVLASQGPFNWPGVCVALPGLDFDAQRENWKHELAVAGIDARDGHAERLAAKFRLTAESIGGAVAGAVGRAHWRDPARPEVTFDDLQLAARTQSTPILSHQAKKITPHYAWEDIVLPEDARAQLREMCAFVEHRHTVYDDWGLGRKLAMGKGLLALFAGSSGTGKTMAADVMAGTLGLDLYKIDLSGVVSKYIGETEKNLSGIFSEAETSNAILFFDEADALFGKRSEVKDAHDRYANIETAYLLQRMEEYSGMVILATNLQANLDEAFLRRLHFVVEFPMPEEEDRLRIWKTTIPPAMPVDEDVDLAFLARQFKIAGGNIRNIVLAAAFMAASEGTPVAMRHLVRGTRREYQKLGRMVTDGEFGRYISLLRT